MRLSQQETMDGHTNNVSFAVFHPNLHIIVSDSGDGPVKIWTAALIAWKTRSAMF